jgi:DEAD/DEAH box helicase domain-containing protein
MVDNLCDEPDRMFKGPFISLGLHFESGKYEAKHYFPELSVPHNPFKHQEMSWERLKAFLPTLIATGTGSGKTECFLYPVLDHVRQQKERGWSGIKAILLYPMNALATDQARRLAKAIFGDPALKNKITAGLYIGGDQDVADKVMGPETVITDRNALRLSPPDILLTNYKMLDYLLTRPKDKQIWIANRPGDDNNPSTLRYLVVDELHTFDGAQGSDLALLIRRLKHRLGCLPGNLCCIGTSATLGGPDNSKQMANYAEQIFGETFPVESLIIEHRQSGSVFLSGTYMDLKGSGFPEWENRERLFPGNFKSPDEYLQAQTQIWFPMGKLESVNDRITLGLLLKGHVAYRALIDIILTNPRTEKEIIAELGKYFEALDAKYVSRVNPSISESEITEFLSHSLLSILALVAHARSNHPVNKDKHIPFVQQLRIQSWVREMRRMVASIDNNPRLDFADDIAQGETNYLPVVYCRECGNAGWVGLVPNQLSDQIRTDDKALGDFL